MSRRNQHLDTATEAHHELARIVALLPIPIGELAAKLGTSTTTLHGWRRVAAGERLDPGQSGRVPPGEDVLAAARRLLAAHGSQVAAALGAGR